jgi:hypothetical protein
MKVSRWSIMHLHVIHAGTLRLRYTKLRETFATHVGRLGLNPITTALSIGSSVMMFRGWLMLQVLQI